MLQEVIDRLLRDLRTTTDLDIDLRSAGDDAVEVLYGSTSAGIHGGGVKNIAGLADRLQSVEIIERLGEAWPRCISHGRHPMTATNEEGGLWICPDDSGFSVRIGELSLSAVDEPRVEDDHVRWFRKDWGWGVIATPPVMFG